MAQWGGHVGEAVAAGQVSGEVEVGTAFGDGYRVAQRVGMGPEESGHRSGRLQAVLAVDLEAFPRFGQGSVEANGGEDVVQMSSVLAVIPWFVGGHCADAATLGQFAYSLVARGVAVNQVLLQLQKNLGLPEVAAVTLHQCLSFRTLTALYQVSQCAARRAQQDDQPVGVGFQKPPVQGGVGTSAGHVGQRHQAAQVGIALPGLGDERDRAGALRLPHDEVHAEYGMQSGG